MTTEDLKLRLLSSLLPLNKRFIDAYKQKPDLYGPFWIYTTLIIVLAISGNLARYWQMGKGKFTYNYEFVPIAATVIYSIGLGLPFLMKVLMRFLGSQFFNGTFLEVRLRFVLMSVDNWYIRILLYFLPDYSIT